MTLETLLTEPQYSRPQADKERTLLPLLKDLTNFHRNACEPYKHIVDLTTPNASKAKKLSELPYIPVSLFKFRRLRSIKESDIRVTVKSSGTGGQQSQIDLDPETASASAKALNTIIGSVTKGQRRPMLIIDHESSISGHNNIGARAAAILGLMPFGRDHCFALKENLQIDEEKTIAFIRQNKNQELLIFGFTFLVWQQFMPLCEKEGFNLSRSILLHSGGWKKLQEQAVDNKTFKVRLEKASKLTRIINFYGMAELPGTVFLENSDGLLYPPAFADIIIRDPTTFEPVSNGTPGLIQILSALPRSYPGHSILTEDIGAIESVDKGVHGRMGQGFRILNRAPRAELRGCSDVLAERAA